MYRSVTLMHGPDATVSLGGQRDRHVHCTPNSHNISLEVQSRAFKYGVFEWSWLDLRFTVVYMLRDCRCFIGLVYNVPDVTSHTGWNQWSGLLWMMEMWLIGCRVLCIYLCSIGMRCEHILHLVFDPLNKTPQTRIMTFELTTATLHSNLYCTAGCFLTRSTDPNMMLNPRCTDNHKSSHE